MIFPGPEEDGGARFEVTACRATWFGRWEIDAVWEPGAGQELPTEYVLVPIFYPTYYGMWGPTMRVTLSGPGAFTLPVSGVHPSIMWELPRGETALEYQPEGLDSTASWSCTLGVVADEPIADDRIREVSAELALEPPLVVHSPGSLQGWLERLDPLDGDEPWLALAWMIGGQDEFPFDVVYLRERHEVQQVEHTHDPPCLGLQVIYEDGVETTQFTGCPPEAPPVEAYDRSEIVQTGTGWYVAATDGDVSQLVPVPWEGHPGAAIEDYDPWTTTTTIAPTTTTFPPGTISPMRLPPFPGQIELAEAWELWESQGLEDYRFTISGWGTFEIFVSGDDISVTQINPPPDRSPETAWKMYGPVERLFALVESRPSRWLTVEYDPIWGYPTFVGYDHLGARDEEWRIRVSDLEPFEGDLPPHGIEPPPSRLRSESFNNVELIVEVTVGPVVDYFDEAAETGWIVTLDDAVVHHLGRRLEPIPDESFEVYDYDYRGPRTLRGHEGERLVLFLSHSAHPSGWRVTWAAKRTDDGLEFLGPRAELSTLNDEVPLLCNPDAPQQEGSTRDAEAEFQLLVRWAQEIDTPGSGGWENALTTVCNSDA